MGIDQEHGAQQKACTMASLPLWQRYVMSYQDVPSKLGLPRIGQLGFLVTDMAHTCQRHGGLLGVQTWYRPNIRRCEHVSQGRLLDQRFKIAIGYSGGIQIEVFQVDGADRDVVAVEELSEEPHLHHLGFFVGDMRGLHEQFVRQGYAALQSGWFSFARRSKTRMAYFDARLSLGVCLELIENRVAGWRIDLPEWYVKLGVAIGQVSRA